MSIELILFCIFFILIVIFIIWCIITNDPDADHDGFSGGADAGGE